MSDAFGFQDRPAPAGEDEGTSLVELLARYWGALKRYYWILVVTCVAGVAIAYVWTERQTRVYEATSKLIFHEAKPNIFGKQIERVEMIDPGGRWQFEQFWNTQREVLRSKWFAERVVKREGLLDDPRFLPPASGEKGPPDPKKRMRQAVGKVLAMSDISLQRDSRVGLVRVRTNHPDLAAKVADGISKSYVEYVREFQASGVGQLANWFDTYVSGKRQELATAREALEIFKRDHNILGLSYEERQALAASDMEAVNAQLREVRAKLFQEEALLKQIDTMERSKQDLRALADLVQNATLRAALDREAVLREELAQVSSRYLDNHPEVSALRERLTTVRKHIDEEILRIRTSVENRVAVIRRNEANLQQELERFKAEIFALNEIGFQYAQMRDSAETLKQHYETVLSRSNELDINALYESDVIQVLETADIPNAPVSPSLPLNLAVGLMIGLTAGAALMVLLDAMDNTVKSEEHVTRATTRPILGTLPAVDPATLKGVEIFGESALDTLTHTAPRSSFAESIKTLRANVMFIAPDNPPKLMLMTSPGPSEGKTSTSVNMAIALAQSGQRTLVVDSDMRRPRVHKALGLTNERGLSTAMTEDARLKDLVVDTGIENLFVVTCGPVPPNPSELLHSERFHRLVAEMREQYDRIIFDSPPLAAVSDALILSHSMDAVFVILKFGQTRRDLLRRSIEQLEAIGAPLLGCVLNDIRDSGTYGYGYAYYRYRYDEPGDQKRKGGKEEKGAKGNSSDGGPRLVG